MNKLTIDGIEYELKEMWGAANTTSTPHVTINGKTYLGEAIPKVPEKDWEIMLATYGAHNFSKGNPQLAEELVKEYGYSIAQVKRTTDNTTWQLDEETEQGKILRFEVRNDLMLVHVQQGFQVSTLHLVQLTKKEVKKPILHFKSEDGYDFVEGNYAYGVNTNTWTIEQYHLDRVTPMYCMKYFYLEMNAIAYVQKNKPKDWTILSLVHDLNPSYSFELQENGKYECDKFPNEYFDLVEDLLENKIGKTYLIKSVLRNSDNEVFSLGDLLDVKYEGKELRIREFRIEGNEPSQQLCAYYEGFTHLHGDILCISKRKCLFTTHDGKDIFEGDEYWFVHPTTLILNYNEIANSSSGKWTDYLYFASEQAANEYILFNKPVLSLNDLLDVWGDCGEGSANSRESFKTAPLFQSFKAVAEKKIKQ